MRNDTLRLLFLMMFLAFGNFSFSQQCSVNAGTDQIITCGNSTNLYADAGWVSSSINDTVQYQVYGVCFPTSYTGYAVGCWGKMYKTIDGGMSWQYLYSGTSFYLTTVSFVDPNFGIASGPTNRIIKTNNGGGTWSVVYTDSNPSQDFVSVQMTDANTAYAGGANGRLVKTTNGGSTWTILNTANMLYIKSMSFPSLTTGYVAGWGGVFKTTDAGATWSGQLLSGNWRSIKFIDENNGFVVGSGSGFKTTNGGATWTSMGPDASGIRIWFTDLLTGYIIQEGSPYKILKTIDGGASWMVAASPTNTEFQDMCFSGSNHGFAVGGDTYNGLNPVAYLYNMDGNTFSWSPSTGLNASNIPNPIANPIQTTNYSVTMTTLGNCSAADDVLIQVDPLTVDAGNDKSAQCGGTVVLNSTTNYQGPSATYLWTPSNGLNSTTIPNPTATVTSNMTYTVEIETPNGCTASDQVSVFIELPSTPEICIVSVDSSGKNIVVWEKANDPSLDYYNIYVESSQTNVFTLIGSVPFDSTGVFMDTNSNPMQQPYRYKISVVDTCGSESPLSNPHKTIHLTINQGMGNSINLLWNSYIGFTYSSFNIYRGTDPGNMGLFASVASNVNSYTDFSPPSGYVYYKIEAIRPDPCDPNKSIISSTLSNISTNNPNTGIGDNIMCSTTFHIYPCPFKGDLTIEDEMNINEIKEVRLMDLFGKEILNIRTDQNLFQLDTKNLIPSVYIIKIKSNTRSYHARLLKVED